MVDLNAYIDLCDRVTAYVRQWQAQRQTCARPLANDLPTVRQLARQFGMRQRDVLTLVEDTDALYNIGVQVSGCGAFVYGRIGDYTVEAEPEGV